MEVKDLVRLLNDLIDLWRIFLFFFLTFCSFIYLTQSAVFASFRVLNEFILKNPNLESKKDQRELQVFFSLNLFLDNGILSHLGFFDLLSYVIPNSFFL